MRNLFVWTFIAAQAVFCEKALMAEPVSDEEIRRLLVLSCKVIDNPDYADDMVDGAFRVSESNRVRFARIICDLARTNDMTIAGYMVEDLGSFGTPEQLPFLYSQISNTYCGARAVRSILRIEGVTSNSLAMVDGYLSMTNTVSRRDREDICVFALDCSPGSVSSEDRSDIERMVLRFAANNSIYNRRFDELLSSRIVGYANSSRRLAVLRAVQQRGLGLGMNQYTEAFVTNAINELVAYPEADLPD